MKSLSLAVLALGLIACGREQEIGEPASAPAAAAPTPTMAPLEQDGAMVVVAPLTQDGWGAVKIGMTHDQVVAALGGKTRPDASTKDDMWKACHMIGTAEPDGLFLMVEKDKLTRITSKSKDIRSDAGLKVGDHKDRVLSVYANIITREPHKYQDAPAEYLTWWAKPEQSGIRYSIGQDGLIQEIHAGGPSIRYVEGCS